MLRKEINGFVESVYRIIAVGLDMPYELLMKDFSKTTYSSARFRNRRSPVARNIAVLASTT